MMYNKLHIEQQGGFALNPAPLMTPSHSTHTHTQFFAQEYFKVAAKYLNATVNSPSVTDVSGIWLSSDDESVFAEVGAVQFKPACIPAVRPQALRS